MATIVLSAAGMALGGSIGGSVLGLSMATIGRAAGATLGRVIDQRILGAGSEPVETGRVDRFRLTGASEGHVVQQIYGRMRVAGQVIWATQFLEDATTTGGGKGAPAKPKTTEYSYSVSMAVALCEGEITRVGRVWADGTEIPTETLNMRVYTGTKDQQPDPKMEAVEGTGAVPAYRGIAYVVFEDLALGQFGNRIPQLTFEVMRPAASGAAPGLTDIARSVRAVAIIPGTGEYALATEPVYVSPSFGEEIAVNVNSPSESTDFVASMTALDEELPNCGSGLLVVSWFGSDLRCGECTVMPKVEQTDVDAEAMPWQVCGLTRSSAQTIAQIEGRPIYGGTPTDASVVQAITEMKARGVAPVFYPFILMEQLAENTLPDPWTGDIGQPALPWRGRITTAAAPGQAGSTDGTAAAAAEVAAFMGTAQPGDFSVLDGKIAYSGPTAWRYRRFILHYAHLCALAGGVSAFCIGSEMRGLTQIREANNSFPAVVALRVLAAEVRAILGPDCKISYAADWSEYHGYQPEGTGDKFFHLDPLWADEHIDFIGIDNYMPLSDWRDSDDHLDAGYGSIYHLGYLRSNIAGGEGYDWYYHSDEARDAQIRTPITDGDDEPWVWRYKDLHAWWAHQHHNRIGGVRQAGFTDWVPQSKPIWFTELGCAAIDKGTNQPNKFLDPKSSESQLPYYSNGMRDDFIQMQYLRAMDQHFANPVNNPVSIEYAGPMVDMGRAHVWAWDSRPYPYFPGNTDLWSDGANYARGHWLNGRTASRTLASVVAEICERSGVTAYDVSRLYGIVRGYVVQDIGTARSALQGLMLTHGFDAIERDGLLVFRNRDGKARATLALDTLALDPEQDASLSRSRLPAAEIAGRVQLGYLDADADYDAAVAETIHPDEASFGVARNESPIVLTASEGRHIVSRWIAEARVARDVVKLALPPSRLDLGAGDVVALPGAGGDAHYRIDRIEDMGLRLVEATRVSSEVYRPQELDEVAPRLRPFVRATPAVLLMMDLPLLTGSEVEHAPHIAVSARPWPGAVAIYDSNTDHDFSLLRTQGRPALVGRTLAPLVRGRSGIWDRQAGFAVSLIRGGLSAAGVDAILAGANTLAIGDGSADRWEVLQFAQSQPLGDRQFALSELLRGQFGSGGLMPDVWPAGSVVALLDSRTPQLDLAASTRGIARHYRYGPASRGLNSRAYRERVDTFQGNGLRPYPVVHLRAKPTSGGIGISWIRCTRIDGDDWSQGEVPLGEEAERYIVRVTAGNVVKREEQVTSPVWIYSAAAMQSDQISGTYTVGVAQVSARFGAGPITGLTLTTP